MEHRIGGKVIRLVPGDITTARVDAMVNAANEHLAGGGGVDGAIHRAGGPEIMAGCRRIGGCPTGSAVATGAGRLPARHVIHAVAPRWRGGGHGELDLLSSAYRTSLHVADALGARSIAFPSLGTGIYGNPIGRAARVALSAVIEHLSGQTSLETVEFYLFSDDDLREFGDVLSSLVTKAK